MPPSVICACCKEGGRGLIEEMPRLWSGCRCPLYGTCEDCGRCYEHCQCAPLVERVIKLSREEDRRSKLLGQAHELATKLIPDFPQNWTTDRLYKIERSLKAQYMAIKRLQRRRSSYEEASSMRHNLEQIDSEGATEIESEHSN